MRKILLPALLLTLLLAGCDHTPEPSPTPTPTPTLEATSTPTPTPTPEPTEEVKELWGFPIDETHDAFEVPTGGKLGTVLVTVEVGKPLYDGTLNTFSVWSTDDLTTPIQQMEAEAYQVFHGHDVVDANFDGYTDFSYIYSWGTGGEFRHYYLWNETAGQFVSVPELTEYGHVGFDAETETVVGYVKSGFAGLDGWEDILRWENGSLVCCRRINRNPCLNADDTITVEITVSDHINGELTEVFFVKSNEVDCWDEIMKWEDLNYHG